MRRTLATLGLLVLAAPAPAAEPSALGYGFSRLSLIPESYAPVCNGEIEFTDVDAPHSWAGVLSGRPDGCDYTASSSLEEGRLHMRASWEAVDPIPWTQYNAYDYNDLAFRLEFEVDEEKPWVLRWAASNEGPYRWSSFLRVIDLDSGELLQLQRWWDRPGHQQEIPFEAGRFRINVANQLGQYGVGPPGQAAMQAELLYEWPAATIVTNEASSWGMWKATRR